MDVGDAIDEAEEQDCAATDVDHLRAIITDIDQAGFELAQDLKYPEGAPPPGQTKGPVALLNHLHPDLMPLIVYHLIRCGWRKDPTKAQVKQRRVVGSPFADLVAYVPLTDPDEPIIAPQPAPPAPWTVRPQLNEIDEKRPQ
ncbi:phage gene 29 protein family protein [Mycobacterium asiaticum]|uniref:phage gene 29 protein family protein n=1 Tax=Mycobacterium asiaticum TaxID=1790 RepID=UPI0007EFEB2E|nr:hypothetical protein [Mycobacterium asiaticum]OBJ54414.1 hypothetical protein A9W94_21230 [Mycobacterium asiaticum]